MEEYEPEGAPIVWYGERGIINALVVALQARDARGWSALLNAVQWADGESHVWLSDIERVLSLVEVGLSEFGDPDLMLVVETCDRQRRLVFIEAKVVSYASSARSNLGRMSQKGFNSTINGQLALRYRFAHALAEWRGGTRLSEPDSLHRAYIQELGDPAQHPRHLQKPGVLEIFKAHGLLGLALQNCYFVALTWDTKPFFNGEPEDTWPRLLDVTGKCIWHDMRSQLGWLGYDQIDRTVALGANYRSALATMIRPTALAMNQPDAPNGPPVTTKNLSLFSGPIQALLRELTARAQAAGFDDVDVHTGSVSVRLAGKVRLKLLPANLGGLERLRLGIAAVEQPLAWCEERLEPGTINDQSFWFITLPTDRDRALDVAEGVFQQLRARHDEIYV